MTAYVPENQRDTAWYLFNKLFMCRVPLLQSMSPDYIRHFGIPISGDPVRDRAFTSEMHTSMIPISKMVEYFKNGVTVRVAKHEDTKAIYQIISNHLVAWKRELEVGLNNRNAPLEELVLLDKFASAVYPHAIQHMTDDFMTGVVADRMLNGMRVNKNNLFMRKPTDPVTPVNQKEPDEPKKPERESLADVFAQRRAIHPGRFKTR